MDHYIVVNVIHLEYFLVVHKDIFCYQLLSITKFLLSLCFLFPFFLGNQNWNRYDIIISTNISLNPIVLHRQLVWFV